MSTRPTERDVNNPKVAAVFPNFRLPRALCRCRRRPAYLDISSACQPVQLRRFCGPESEASRRAHGRLPRECGLPDRDERNPATTLTRPLPPERCHVAAPAGVQPPSPTTPGEESSGEYDPDCAASPLPKAKYRIQAMASRHRRTQ